MKKIVLLAILPLLYCSGYGQNQKRGDRVHTEKVAFLSKEIGLTTEEAAQFWTIYDSYWQELKEAHRATRKYLKDLYLASSDNSKESVIESKLDVFIESMSADAEIHKRYKERFLKVISANKVCKMYKAEEDFRVRMICKLRERDNS